ncbi:MAG: TonB-dependent receptor [Tannerellaceae bacterium]|jgi:TonB-linked SusC/RagA family outer membrane protein|nr:TonB-dependent receptor [Tannerellaceae bacterium]
MKKCKCLFFLLFISASVVAAVDNGAHTPKSSATGEILSPLDDREITGYVYDVNGDPLLGVNVIVKGGSVGAVTDRNGRFTLKAPAGAELEISYIGYVKQTVAVADNLRIVLEEDMANLDEVIVIGYGTVKKSDLTGAVSSVAAKSFLDQPGSSINSVLQGRAPGVVVRRGNGAPGSGSTIRIRGVNSILGNNDPLIVVDGNYGSMPNLYDIESIEILKDASATAIYGSKGANGVVIVTTKRGGGEGKNEVKVYSNISFDQVPRRYDIMEAAEYAEFMNQTVTSIPGGVALFSDADIAYYREHGGTDWQDEIFRTGITQSYKATLTGGNNKVKYYVSPAYSHTDGILINTSSESYGLGAKLDVELSSRISYQVEAGINHGSSLNPNLGSGGDHMSLPLQSALIWAPTAKVFNEDGTYQSMDPLSARTLNPVLLTTLEDTRYSNSGNAVGNVRIKIIDGLEFNGKASIGFSTGGSRYYISKALNGNIANASQSSSENKSWLVNAFLTYSKAFAKNHQFSAMLGFEESQGKYQDFRGAGNDLSVPSVKWYNLAVGKTKEASSGYSNEAMRSFFTRLTYNYGSRYYFTGTYRADGSSKFAPGNQFSYFPSFALSWRLSEEAFLKETGLFDNLKIRGGWGVTGSQAIGSYATLSPMDSNSYSWGTSQPYAGYRPGVAGNKSLQWEETKQTDLGLDISVLKGKLSIAFDYYMKQTEALLSRVGVPLYNGGGSIQSNIGKMENKGFEINLNYVLFENRAWSYEINLNGSHNRNKVIDIGEQERLWGGGYATGVLPSSPFIILPGQPIGTIYGYKYLGIWQRGHVMDARAYGQEPGDYRYEDLNKNGEYDAGDYQIIGNSNPKFTWGFNNHLSWKNWDLNVLFEGLHGRDILNLNYAMVGNILDNSMSITSREGKNRWTPENPWAEFSKPSLNNMVKPNSDQWIQDGSYIKVRNLSLAYRFTKKMTRFADIRLAVSCQNVFTFTKYKGYDPEVSSANGSNVDTDAGIDWYAYPNPRSYTFSLILEY